MAERTAITIGNFDGVHLGHQQLIRRARQEVGKSGRIIALTFDPHPAGVLNPGQSVSRLSSIEQRRDWLIRAGSNEVSTIATTPDLLRLSPEQFISRHIVPHRPSVLVEGADFRFGHRRAGSVETLRQAGADNRFEVAIVDPVEATLSDQATVRVSSSMIRWLLERGRVHDASLLLGRRYELRGCIVRGDQRGRTIGFPTMNLNHGEFLLPADGIYAGQATLPDGRSFAAAISVGTKPTFGFSPRICEAYLLDFDGPLDDYGFTLQLCFSRWLRDQLKYDDVNGLIEQLHRDVEAVRRHASHCTEKASHSRPAIGCAAT